MSTLIFSCFVLLVNLVALAFSLWTFHQVRKQLNKYQGRD